MSGTENVCPVCGARQDASLLCSSCCDRLERELGDVQSLVTELDTAKSKMARIGNPSGPSGLARERNPISWGAVEAADTLGNVLTTWARDLMATENGVWLNLLAASKEPAATASNALLLMIPTIRRHPAVAELVDEITDAVEQARRAVDRPADRMYLGQCATVFPDEDGIDVECYAEIWARVDAHEARCVVCGITHEVAERRRGLLDRAKDVIVTAKQASEYMGEVGGVAVNQKTIRTWLDREELPLRQGLTSERHFRLGDLMELLGEKATRRAA